MYKYQKFCHKFTPKVSCISWENSGWCLNLISFSYIPHFEIYILLFKIYRFSNILQTLYFDVLEISLVSIFLRAKTWYRQRYDRKIRVALGSAYIAI